MIPLCSYHALSKNNVRFIPRRMIYFDVETRKIIKYKTELNRIKCAWACYYERRGGGRSPTESWRYFEGAKELCEWIQARVYGKTALYLFAHNIFFDLQSSDFFYYFNLWGWHLEFYHDKGMSYALIIRKGRKFLKAVSTTNFYDFSLAGIGEMVGLPKLGVDFETVDDLALSRYCRRDVEILKLAMEKYFRFIQDHDLARFSITKAAQAMNAFRHRFMGRKIYFHDHLQAEWLEKDAYIGGRTEAFFLGKVEDGPFLTLDVNSMYPYVMKNYPLPCKLIDYTSQPTIRMVEDAVSKYAVIAECCLFTDQPIYAVRLNKKICFPVGKIVAGLCTGGIKEALRRGHLVRARSMACYEQDVLFDKYVDYFYALKQRYEAEGNRPYQKIIKIFLNSLYGKFAQYVPIQTSEEDFSEDGYYREEILNAETGQVEMVYKMFNTVVRETGREIGKKSFVAVSAHITEYARLILWEIIKPLRAAQVLYCDTDSIMLRAKDLPAVEWPVDDHNLGALKIQKRFNRLEIRGAKSYITENERVIKGVPKSAEEIDPYTFEFLSFAKQATHMKKRIDRWVEGEKKIRVCKPFYDKGEVGPDGSIMPFFLTQW